MRNEGIGKMGFYPTPNNMMAKIACRLVYTGPTRLFDPCCGEGEALESITKLAPVGSLSYGIELDGYRAEESTKRLDHTVHTAYERARVDTASMQMCLLNPPYDQKTGLGGLEGRTELVFLRDISKFVAPDGILVFIIPRYTLGPDMVRALVNRYTDLAVYRFDDEDYKAYKQVVVFGRRREKMLSNFKALTTEEQNARNTLTLCGKDESAVIPYLDEADGRLWTVPAAEDIETPVLFRGYLLDEHEMRLDLRGSEAFQTMENLLLRSAEPSKLRRPLLPYRRTHMATLIASGALNGAVGVGEARHMVVGITRKVVEREIVPDENGGDPTIFDRESYVTVVRTVQPNGNILDLA